MIYVTRAQYVDDYKLMIEFNNQQKGIIDLAQVIKHDHRPIFTELMDKEKFKRFHVEADTVVWDNGLDIAPEFLYAKLTKTNGEFFEKMNS